MPSLNGTSDKYAADRGTSAGACGRPGADTAAPESTAPEKRPFVIMAKPVGNLCNMRCDYCYYIGTEYDGAPAVMRDDLLETFIRKYIEESKGPVVSFTWHGGEPSLAGIGFYEKVLALEEKYLPEGFTCWNNLQTNGTFLDDTWCAFLAEHRFDVGVSIDGTAALHDRYRHFAGGEAGRSTYEVISRNIRRLIGYGIRPDLLCTVTSDTARCGREVYRALRSFDTGWIQFIPIVRKTGAAAAGAGSVTADSVTPDLYGEFLKDVFAEWFFHDLGRVNVQFFAEVSAALAGGTPSLCWMAKECGNVLIAEHNGDIYSCDHFADAAHRIGNVKEDSFQALLAAGPQRAFGQSKYQALTKECLRCPYLSLCGGGCLKDRFARSEDGGAGQYFLCGGLKSFFRYAVPHLTKAMKLSAQHCSPEQIMRILAEEERQKYQKLGRNDPCPCQSGRKFKQCCAKRVP